MTKIIDISPTIQPSLAVWPGDTSFSREVLVSIESSNIELSTIRSTVHLGAHTDAPIHYHKEGQKMEERELEYYLGPVQVISVNLDKGQRILPEHIKTNIQCPRVLFKTGSFPDPSHFNEDFNSLSPELIRNLSAQGVCLVGIDTPSIDPFESKALEAHSQVYAADMAILEGVLLSEVQEGGYTLVATPLKIKGADASPVRALLIEGESDILASVLPLKFKS